MQTDSIKADAFIIGSTFADFIDNSIHLIAIHFLKGNGGKGTGVGNVTGAGIIKIQHHLGTVDAFMCIDADIPWDGVKLGKLGRDQRTLKMNCFHHST